MLARSPNRKRAVAYLAACGAIPITIVVRDGGCSIHSGKIAGTIAARWWIAARVAAQARRFAGKSPDVAASPTRLQRSAVMLKAILMDDTRDRPGRCAGFASLSKPSHRTAIF